MNGDSRDVDYLGDPLLCSIISNLRDLRHVTRKMHTFVSSEGCHIVAEACCLFANSGCLMLGYLYHECLKTRELDSLNGELDIH